MIKELPVLIAYYRYLRCRRAWIEAFCKDGEADVQTKARQLATENFIAAEQRYLLSFMERN